MKITLVKSNGNNSAVFYSCWVLPSVSIFLFPLSEEFLFAFETLFICEKLHNPFLFLEEVIWCMVILKQH